MPTLVQNMDPGPVIRELRSKQILTSDDEENINGHVPRHLKVEHLLNTLLLKSDLAYMGLVHSLIDTQQGHVAQVIDEHSG